LFEDEDGQNEGALYDFALFADLSPKEKQEKRVKV